MLTPIALFFAKCFGPNHIFRNIRRNLRRLFRPSHPNDSVGPEQFSDIMQHFRQISSADHKDMYHFKSRPRRLKYFGADTTVPDFLRYACWHTVSPCPLSILHTKFSEHRAPRCGVTFGNYGAYDDDYDDQQHQATATKQLSLLLEQDVKTGES